MTSLVKDRPWFSLKHFGRGLANLLLMALAVLALAQSAPADPAGADPGGAQALSPAWQKIYQIADRFGGNGGALPGPIPPPWPSLEQVATGMEDRVDIALTALAQSNAQGDLSAPSVPTGDALFDRYAQAVDARLNEPLPPDTTQLPNYGALDDALLAEWEPEFGRDPRYWELRYLCALGQGVDAQLAADYTQPADYLAEARKRGVATANTLLLLADALPDEATTERLALLDEAVSLAPEQAWTYYYRALYRFQQGEMEQGMADLTHGNAAPAILKPLPYPLSETRQGLLGPAPLGSAAVDGALYVLKLSLPQNSITQWKKALKAVLDPAAGQDLARASEQWHQFACRFAVTPTQAIDPLVALVLSNLVRTAVLEASAASLTSSQQATIDRMLGACEELKRLSKLPQFDSIYEAIVFIATGGLRGLHVAFYLEAEEDAKDNQACQAVLADLAQAHYPELATPECMLKYEALTQEEYDRRKAEKRAAHEAEGK